MNLLDDLNDKQREAVTAPLGPVLVLAGAGSGKTRALTYRIAYLIASQQFEPHHILAVTFTNKAATEMKERIHALLTKELGASLTTLPALGTFHSICARILRREIHRLEPYTASFTIFDSDDSLRAIKQIIKSFDWERDISPTYAKSIISSIKNQKININEIEEEGFARLYDSYQNLLREVNAVDFDDLLLLVVAVFKKFPNVLARYQAMWPYVLVDEYQDTNGLQYELIQLLTAKSRNVFAVGDDAQSIYGFRGANYRNILNFERDYPDATVVALEENYRSTHNILRAANEVIKLSPAQKKKNLWTQNGDGGRIIRYTAIDEIAEAMFVAGEVLALSGSEREGEDADDEPTYIAEADGFGDSESFFDRFMKKGSFASINSEKFSHSPEAYGKLKTMAVLYRTNAQSRIVEEVMLKNGIPYHMVGSVRFYERKEIKDILSYLRLLLNEKDTLSLARIVNVPPRAIGEKSFELIRQGNESSLSTRARNSWESFNQKMASIRATPPEHMLVEILRLIEAKFDLEDYYLDGSSEGEDRWQNVRELATVAAKFNNLPWSEALGEFLAEVALYSETDEVGSKRGITLMTMHQAKGLEFDTVFMVGLEEGILPHSRSLEPGGDVSEEIRLAYVGLTRARKNLYLTNAYTRRIFGSSYNLKPSRILKAIPDEIVEHRDSWA